MEKDLSQHKKKNFSTNEHPVLEDFSIINIDNSKLNNLPHLNTSINHLLDRTGENYSFSYI